MIKVFGWLMPGALILGVAIALVSSEEPAGVLADLGPGFPGLIFGLVVVLAAFFHRSRVALYALGLASLTIWVSGSESSDTGFLLLAGLLCFGLGLLAITKDRGVFSIPGLVQMGAFALMFGMGWVLVRVAPREASGFLSWTPAPLPDVDWIDLPQPIFFAFVFAMVSGLLVGIRRRGPVEKGWLWSLVFVGFALSYAGEPSATIIFLVGAGVVLGLSVLETSYAMAYKDDLTGLPARRALMRDLGLLGGVYTVAMVDVDHFKKFNDRYGHDVGDQVLRMVAARLAKAPAGGKAYRYGGEEFTILYSGRGVKETLSHLKDVRRAVEEATFTLRSWRRPRKKPVDPGAWRGGKKKKPRRLSVTVSIGVADSAGKETSPDLVLKKADRALYRAKKAGRNRVAK